MSVYSVSGRTAATAATADHVIGALWNPHANLRIKVLEVHLVRNGTSGGRPGIYRTDTRGTAGSTVTPDDSNDWDAVEAPRSGALLDMAAYSAQPTLRSPAMYGGGLATATGSTAVCESWIFPDGIWLPPSEGLAIVTFAAVAFSASDVTFVWEEAS